MPIHFSVIQVNTLIYTESNVRTCVLYTYDNVTHFNNNKNDDRNTRIERKIKLLLVLQLFGWFLIMKFVSFSNLDGICSTYDAEIDGRKMKGHD